MLLSCYLDQVSLFPAKISGLDAKPVDVLVKLFHSELLLF